MRLHEDAEILVKPSTIRKRVMDAVQKESDRSNLVD